MAKKKAVSEQPAAPEGRRSAICNICKHENDLGDGIYTCEKCGSFLSNKNFINRVTKLNNRKFGASMSVPMMASENPFVNKKMSVISTSSLLLDRALRTNGIPVGSRVEISGNDSSGKTTLSLQIIAELQKKNGVCLFIDMEHTFDYQWAETLGVNCEELVVSCPDSGTQAVDLIANNCELYDLIVLDSIASMAPESQVNRASKIEKGVVKDSYTFAGPAKLLSDLQKNHISRIGKSGCTIIMLNQLRDNITNQGAMGTLSPGGWSAKHFPTHRIKLRTIGGKNGVIKVNGEDAGVQVEATVVKNKKGKKGIKVIIPFIDEKGFCKDREYLDLAIESKFFVQAGSWYKQGEKSVAQGYENLIDYINSDKDLKEEMMKYVNNYLDEELQSG